MAKGLSPTQRTLRALREQGRIAAITEKWNPWAGPLKKDRDGNLVDGSRVGVRQDLFGFVDVLTLDPARGFVAVQACSGNPRSHIRKICGESPRSGDVGEDHRQDEIYEAARAWLIAGGFIEVWCWRKVLVKRGGKAKVWAPRVTEITAALLRIPHEELEDSLRSRSRAFLTTHKLNSRTSIALWSSSRSTKSWSSSRSTESDCCNDSTPQR